MTQPHHHAFNALEAVFHRTVKINLLLPVLIAKGVISSPQHDWLLKELDDDQNGIKVLTGYLRSKDYDTFVGFIECVFEAGTADMKLMQSVREVVSDFDKRNNTSHAERIALLIDKYSTKTETITQQDDLPHHDITAEHKKLSISDLDLTFLNDDLIQFSFNSDTGGVYHNEEFDITIEAPPGVTSDSDEVIFELGVCACGPFAIKDDFQVITGFICIDTSSKLHKPVRITLQHCLKMMKYEKTHSVIILKADHQEQTSSGLYVFGPYWGYEVGDDGHEERRQIVRPEISPSSPHLWFEMDEFCILCGVLKKDDKSVTLDSGKDKPEPKDTSNSLTSAGATRPPPLDRNPVTSSSFENTPPTFGKSPSLEQDTTIERSGSSASSTLAASSHPVTSNIARPENEPTPRKTFDMKRKQSSMYEEHKDRCCVEYAVMFIGPSTTSETNKFHIFICQYCNISIMECLKQAGVNTRSRVPTKNQLISMYQGVFCQLELTVSCIIDNPDWEAISDRTPVIKESDIHLQQRSYIFNDVKNLCSLKLYPPRLEFSVYARSNNDCSSPRTHCKFLIDGFKFSDTLEAYFSIILNRCTTLTTGNQPIMITTKAGKLFQKYYKDFKNVLRYFPTDTLIISSFLYSNWVIEFDDLRDILVKNSQPGVRATILLDCLLEKIEGNGNHLLTLYDILDNFPPLRTFKEEMKKEFGCNTV